MTDVKPLLVCVDFSNLTPSTVEYASQLAQGRGTKVDLLHVMSASLPAHAQAHAPADLLEKIRKGEEVNTLRDLEQLMATVPEPHQGRILIRRGSAAEQICEAAGDGYEMVVVSTQGRTGLSHMLIGSVAERVVRHAPIPVLVVR